MQSAECRERARPPGCGLRERRFCRTVQYQLLVSTKMSRGEIIDILGLWSVEREAWSVKQERDLIQPWALGRQWQFLIWRPCSPFWLARGSQSCLHQLVSSHPLSVSPSLSLCSCTRQQRIASRGITQRVESSGATNRSHRSHPASHHSHRQIAPCPAAAIKLLHNPQSPLLFPLALPCSSWPLLQSRPLVSGSSPRRSTTY